MIKASTRKSQHKNALKMMALGMFPETKVTLKTCDALLIGEYGRRKFQEFERLREQFE
jgi:hypothetical protein